MWGRISASAKARAASRTRTFSGVRLKSTMGRMLARGRSSIAVGHAPRAGLGPALEAVADLRPHRAIPGRRTHPDGHAAVGQAGAVGVAGDRVIRVERLVERPHGIELPGRILD